MSTEQLPTPSRGDQPTGGDAQDLEREVVRLRARVAELEPVGPPRHRVRQVIAAVLAVLTVISIVATTVAAWERRTAFDTGRFMGLAEPVLESPQVADVLSVRLTGEVVTALDLQDRLATALTGLGDALTSELAGALDLSPAEQSRIEALPLPQLEDLAGPIASGLEARIGTRIDEFVRSEDFQNLLVQGVEAAHPKVVALLRGQYDQLPNVDVAAGQVTLNLVPAVAAALEDLVDQGLAAVGIQDIPFIDPFADPQASLDQLSSALGVDLPPDFGQVTVMSEAELAELQTAARVADQLVWVLLVVTIVLLAATVAIAPRRRRTIVGLSLGTAAGLVLTMLLLRSTQDEVANQAPTAQGRAAVALLTDATLDSLRSVMVVVLVLALVVAAVTYLLGRPPWVRRTAAWVRLVTAAKPGGSDLERFVGRYHDPLRVGVIAVGVIVLFVIGFSLWSVLIVPVLVLLALWGLQTVRNRQRAAEAMSPPVPATARPAPPEEPVGGSQDQEMTTRGPDHPPHSGGS